MNPAFITNLLFEKREKCSKFENINCRHNIETKGPEGPEVLT